MRSRAFVSALAAAAVLACVDSASPRGQIVDPVGPPGAGVRGRSYFVAPDGSAVGNGSIEQPWSLITALAQPTIVEPGDTIWLRGGTYRSDYTSRLKGSAAAPVVLRQYPGERATIDGRLSIEGEHALYWGFEVTYSNEQRVTSNPGSDPADLPRERKTVFVVGQNIKLIHLIVHDLGDGIFASSAATNLELSGNLVYNNGWIGPDRGHGHNIYLQNATPTKYVLDNVVFGSFAYGLHIYGSSAAVLKYFQIEGNTIFESGTPAEAIYGATANILHYGDGGNFGATTYRGNSLYHRVGATETVKLGLAGGRLPGTDIEFRENIVHGRSTFNELKGLTIADNQFAISDLPVTGSTALVALRMPTGEPYSVHAWNRNRYAVVAGSTQKPFYIGTSSANLLFPQWREVTGYDSDANSSMTERFSGSKVIVRPSTYEPGRAFVTCWNWDGAAALNVDLSSVLSPGDRYEIHHVYDVFGPALVTGTYRGAGVSVPQPGVTPPVPTGYQAYGQPTPDFGVFLVRMI